MTSEAFCSSGKRDREERNPAARVSFFKSFSLKTFIAFVILLRNTVTNVARDTAARWTGTKLTVAICERVSY